MRPWFTLGMGMFTLLGMLKGMLLATLQGMLLDVLLDVLLLWHTTLAVGMGIGSACVVQACLLTDWQNRRRADSVA